MSFAFFISCFELNPCKRNFVLFPSCHTYHPLNETKLHVLVLLRNSGYSKEHWWAFLAYDRLGWCSGLYFCFQIVFAPLLEYLNFPISLTRCLSMRLALASGMWAEAMLWEKLERVSVWFCQLSSPSVGLVGPKSSGYPFRKKDYREKS